MMRWIIGSSIKFRYLVLAGAAALIAVGVLQLRNAPVDVFPEFAPPRVEIQTITLGLSATETEELVTVPLEQALQGLPDLDTIRSKSVPLLSSITLYFDRGTDLLKARQLVSERVGNVTPTLPTWAAPPVMIQPLSATSRVMKIGLSSDTVSLIDMSMLAYWKLRARLLTVPGVANAPIWGERLHMFQVEVDPARMAANQVSLNQVMESTANALDSGLLQFSDGSVIGTGGFVDTPNQRLTIEHVQPIVTPDALAKITVPNRDGTEMPLSSVADVVVDHQPLWGDGVINDGPGLMLIVEKLPWANTLDVTRGVEDAIAEMRPGLPGIEIDTTIFRPASFIEESIDNLKMALIIGSILVVIVIAAFLFEWRAALISLVAMPLSVVAAGLVLYWRGQTINVMVLAGIVIALGVIVDDAIIDVENIVRRLRQHRADGSDKSTASIILDASLEMRGPIVYATLIVVLGIVPVFFLEGLTGAFFQPLASSYALAVHRVAARCPHGHACDEHGAAPEVEARAARVTDRTVARARLRAAARADHPPSASRLRRGRRSGCGRRSGRAVPRADAAARFQGAGLPDALADAAEHVWARGDPDLGPGVPGASDDSGRAQLRLAHRPGAALGRGRRHLLRRELDQRRSFGRLRRDARQGAGGGRGLPGDLP